MGTALLERHARSAGVDRSLNGLILEAAERLTMAGSATVESLDDGALGASVSELARIESRSAAMRLALSAEADRRRVAHETAETGTDAWLARLTENTREQMARGLWMAGLLRDKYAVTREAFAVGDPRLEQVRVVVNAAEQAPVEATEEQVASAEQWLVDKAIGAGCQVRPPDGRQATASGGATDVRSPRPRSGPPPRGDPARPRGPGRRDRDLLGAPRQRGRLVEREVPYP